MFDTVMGTDAVKQQREGMVVGGTISKLDAIISQNGVDSIGYSGDEMT